MSWEAVPICDDCWRERNPLEPVRLKEPETEVCWRCGHATRSGIYVREEIEE